MIKFVHTGDIHLDSPFSLKSPSVSEKLRQELRKTFNRLIEYIIDENIDLCLMPGDLFDTEYAAKDTINTLLSGFSKADRCKFIISPGNHDPYTDRSIYKNYSFPENVYIFSSSEYSVFSFPEINTDIYGYAFTSPSITESPIQNLSVQNNSAINILCAHCEINNPLSTYAPITENEICSKGFDYAALAHIHASDGIKMKNNTYYGYCGCLMGRDFSESGRKGAIVGTIEKSNNDTIITTHYEYFSDSQYAIIEQDISDLTTINDISDIIKTKIEELNFNENTYLRTILSGNTTEELYNQISDLPSNIQGIGLIEIINNTNPQFDHYYLNQDPTIKGEFYRQLLPQLKSDSPDERKLALLALKYGLTAIEGNDININGDNHDN